MSEHEGKLERVGQVLLIASRWHERITRRLLEGARDGCDSAGISGSDVDIWWVDGAFEIGVAVASATRSGRYQAVVALGVVIRGETPHFDYIAGETAGAIARLAAETLVPVGFGVLTCDTVEQAMARSGGDAGNKGREAAEAAIRTASLLGRVAWS